MTTQRIIPGDCIAGLRTLPDASVHCCVTSPPYWGLRDYGHEGQIGLEQTPEEYVARMVEMFREVWRVLRDDGTLWLNLGDSYCGGGGYAPDAPCNKARAEGESWGAMNAFSVREGEARKKSRPGYTPPGLKPKDLVGIPWRVAFALQADGWWLRQDIIWHKPNPMPESVRDRCTKAHEYVFLLTKSQRYFYDAEAVSEAVACERGPGNKKPLKGVAEDGEKHRTRAGLHKAAERWRENGPPQSRNRRSVWTITTKPYSGAHFAVMPPEIVEPCVKAGTSEEGCCPHCGAPWERVSETRHDDRKPYATIGTGNYGVGSGRNDGSIKRAVNKVLRDDGRGGDLARRKKLTTGWRPTCDCPAHQPVPCTVLDPFAGSGTTLAVAAELGRNGIGCELNPDYITLAEKRIAEARGKVALFA